MSKRTSPLAIVFRFFVLIFAILLLLSGGVALLGVAVAPLMSIGFLLVVALAGTAILNGVLWLLHRIGFGILFGHTKQYRQFRATGGDPWFHYGCPAPFNCDSEEVRLTGADQPVMCPNCGTVALDENNCCPHCGHEEYPQT